MDLVSPIQFKKLDFSKFDKSDEIPFVFYDKYSNNLVHFSDAMIKIYNKKATNLKKSVNLKLDSDKINIVAVDKHLRYMLILLDYKMTLIINLRTETVADILHYDFSSVLGMFFISNTSSFHANDDLKFALVFINKLVFFKITFVPNESINEIKTVKLSSILNFYYNCRFMILALEKSEKVFDFYNLSSDKFYSKTHSFSYLSKLKRETSIGRLFTVFSRSSSRLEGFVDMQNSSKFNLYKKTQFFLETL
jgi:hypothetical protein